MQLHFFAKRGKIEYELKIAENRESFSFDK